MKKRKRLQFSQKMVVVSIIYAMTIVALMVVANFILLWNGKQTMANETIQAIVVYGGIVSTATYGGYCALSGARDLSKNKHLKGKLDGEEE